MKHIVALFVLVAIVFPVLANERQTLKGRNDDPALSGDPFVPTTFPIVAVDQARRPQRVATNLQDDFDDWWETGGGVDICINPQSTVQRDKKCTFDPAAPEIKFCTAAPTKFSREVNAGSVAQKCKTCPH